MLLGSLNGSFDTETYDEDHSQYVSRRAGFEILDDLDQQVTEEPEFGPLDELDLLVVASPASEPLLGLNQPAPTDSGFESGTRDMSAPPQSSVKNLEVVSEEVGHAHDSAFVGSQPEIDEEGTPGMGLYSAPTTYSASVASDQRTKEYMTELAAELFGVLKIQKPDLQTKEHMSRFLPDLLRAFALKLGHKAQTQDHLDISFFVHKYREYADTFRLFL